jgi:hypothetical protein
VQIAHGTHDPDAAVHVLAGNGHVVLWLV